jgi:dTDP-4-amino-4,6-dideoxygalactose transaminase
MALELGASDMVWTTPNTFVASANCARYCGAKVDFVDIDPNTYNLSTEALESKLETTLRKGAQLPSVVIPVHFAGQSCDMRSLARLARLYGFRIVEDASHAIGGRYEDRPVGCCDYSDVCVFSFHPVKIITSGEGGMAVTRCSELASRMSNLRTHGIVRTGTNSHAPAAGNWFYEQQALGYNYRLTDIQAALGLSQMSRLDSYVSQRHALARRYDEELAGTGLRLPHQGASARSSLHLYPVQVPDVKGDGIARLRLYDYLHSRDIGVNVHYIPVHTQPYYQALGHRWGDYPVAEAYYTRTISLPLFPAMSQVEQDHVIACLKHSLEVRQAA